MIVVLSEWAITTEQYFDEGAEYVSRVYVRELRKYSFFFIYNVPNFHGNTVQIIGRACD